MSDAIKALEVLRDAASYYADHAYGVEWQERKHAAAVVLTCTDRAIAALRAEQPAPAQACAGFQCVILDCSGEAVGYHDGNRWSGHECGVCGEPYSAHQPSEFECCGDFPCSKENVPPHREDCPGCSGFPTERAVAATVPCAVAEYGFTDERNNLIEDLLPAGANIEGWQQALVDEFVEYVSGVVRASENAGEISRVAGELGVHGAMFLDPPDGGSVTPSEQVARLGKAYRKAHALLFAASEALETICDGPLRNRPRNMEVYAQCRNVLAAIEAVLHRDGASGVPPGPRDCPKDPSGCVG